MVNLVKGIQSVTGNPENKGVSRIEDEYRHKSGKLVLSNRDFEQSSSIIITDDGVKIIAPHLSASLSVDDGVNIQGVVLNTGKGANIKKGEYSENPKSAKLFTYKETILLESAPKEILAEVKGKLLGDNTTILMDGVIPLFTDISAGPLPHFHTINTKHVHRTEPAYIYRVPGIVQMFQGAMSQLKQFFSI